jgi:hypothetical protein
MRIRCIYEPRGFLQRAAYFLMRSLAGRLPGPVAVQSFRRGLFGKYYAPILRDSLRGESSWSFGERELFAALVAAQNQCAF